MEWYEKFRVGQEVKVVKCVQEWNYGMLTYWNNKYMDGTVGKIYTIQEIRKNTGFNLNTRISFERNGQNSFWDYFYPAESLESVKVKGQQLMFSFMKE